MIKLMQFTLLLGLSTSLGILKLFATEEPVKRYILKEEAENDAKEKLKQVEETRIKKRELGIRDEDFLYFKESNEPKGEIDVKQETSTGSKKQKILKIYEYRNTKNYFIDQKATRTSVYDDDFIPEEPIDKEDLRNFKKFHKVFYVFGAYNVIVGFQDSISSKFGGQNVYSTTTPGHNYSSTLLFGFGLNFLREIIKIEFDSIYNLDTTLITPEQPMLNLTNADYKRFGAYRFKLAISGNLLFTKKFNEHISASLGVSVGAYNFKAEGGVDAFIFGLGPVGDLSFVVTKKLEVFTRIKAAFFFQDRIGTSAVNTTVTINSFAAGSVVNNLNIQFGPMLIFSFGCRFYS